MKKSFLLSLLIAGLSIAAHAFSAAVQEPFQTFLLGQPAVTSIAGTEVMYCSQGGTSKQCTAAQLLAFLSANLPGSPTRISSLATLPAISSTDNIGFVDWSPSSACSTVFPAIGTSGITAGGFQTIIRNSGASSQPPCAITATTSTINGILGSTPYYLPSGDATAIVWTDNTGTNYDIIQIPSSTINPAPEQYWIDTAQLSSTNVSNWTYGTSSGVFALTLWDDAWANSSTGLSVTRLGSGSNGYYVFNVKIGGYVGSASTETGGTYTFTGTGPASFSGVVRSYGFVPTGIGFCGISAQPIFNAPFTGWAGVCTNNTQAVEWNQSQGQINFGNITVDTSGSPTFFWQDTSQAANQTIWDADTTGGNWTVRTLTDAYGTGNNAIQAVRGTGTAIASLQLGFGATTVGIGGASSAVSMGQTTSTTNIYGATIGIGNASDTITVGATSSTTNVNGTVTLGANSGTVNVGSSGSTVTLVPSLITQNGITTSGGSAPTVAASGNGSSATMTHGGLPSGELTIVVSGAGTVTLTISGLPAVANRQRCTASDITAGHLFALLPSASSTTTACVLSGTASAAGTDTFDYTILPGF
jgi:hypothetical protein